MSTSARLHNVTHQAHLVIWARDGIGIDAEIVPTPRNGALPVRGGAMPTIVLSLGGPTYEAARDHLRTLLGKAIRPEVLVVGGLGEGAP